MTTVLIGRTTGRVYDLGKGEFPSGADRPATNAFTCTQEEADKLRGNRKVRKYKPSRADFRTSYY
jgi:hypothetical protein